MDSCWPGNGSKVLRFLVRTPCAEGLVDCVFRQFNALCMKCVSTLFLIMDGRYCLQDSASMV